jgi:tellurite resistance protein
MPRRRLSKVLVLIGLLVLCAVAWGRVGSGSGASFPGFQVPACLSGRAPIGWSSAFLLLASLLIVLGAIRAVAERHSDRSTTRALADLAAQRTGTRRQPPEKVRQGLARIVEHDPGFSAESFLLQAEKTFVEIQQGWSNRDLSGPHRLMSDGLLQRFLTRVELDDFRGKRSLTGDPRVIDKAIVGAESDDDLDFVEVRLRASLRDCAVPASLTEREMRARLSRAPKSTFVEVWSFVRHPISAAKGRLSEGSCPSCGAPLTRGSTATCDYCGAILNSGAFDWVLCEISQESELRASPPSVEGFARLKALDPSANRQVLEDRAGLVFWKWIEAMATGQPKRFARYCSPRAYSALLATEGKPAPALAQAAVAGIDLLHVESDAEQERAWFLVRWSTTSARARIARTSVLHLSRKAGLKTNPKAGLATDRCQGCAAPQTCPEAEACEHCGAPLSLDWAFVELVTPEAFQAQRQAANREISEIAARIGTIADPWERRRALGAMVAAARVDGAVGSSEQRLLESCSKRWGLESVLLKALLSAPLDQMKDLAPKSADEGRLLFRALAVAAWVDGRVDPAERKLLERMAIHLKLSPEESSSIVSELGRSTEHPAS